MMTSPDTTRPEFPASLASIWSPPVWWPQFQPRTPHWLAVDILRFDATVFLIANQGSTKIRGVSLDGALLQT